MINVLGYCRMKMEKKTFQYDLSLESLLVLYQVHYIEAVKITHEGTRMNSANLHSLSTVTPAK